MREYYKKIETNGATNLDEIGRKIAGFYDESGEDDYYIENGELFVEFPEDWDEMDERDKKELLDYINQVVPRFVEFKLISSKDSRIYLKGVVNINTIDDSDGGDWEYEQNNGLFENHLPLYWKCVESDLTDEFNDFINTIDWDMFRQWLWDFQDEDIAVDFHGNILIINEGECKHTTIRLKQTTKLRLNAIGERGESYDSIINQLINYYHG